MRISTLRIKNFRAFDDQEIQFDDYTCFVGPNGSGKSTILNALNVIFREQSDPTDVNSLIKEDFHLGITEEAIEITVTFTNLSDEAKEELSAYVRQDKLILKARAEWDESSRKAEVVQCGVRDVIEDFSRYFQRDDEGALAKELKAIYQQIREEYADLPHETVKANMRGALREYEEEHPDLCEPVDSGDQFYGWSRGTNKLEKYLQWVYVPAVKDPADEQEEARGNALGKLLDRTIRAKVDFETPLEELRSEIGDKYRSLVDSQKEVLNDLQGSIEVRLREWAHPQVEVDLHWSYDPNKSVTLKEPSARTRIGEGPFMGDVVRLGHGLQRSFLLAVLQEEALTAVEEAPTLLLAIEEPELYQHPPQARHLATVLERISSENSQVLITTHSPYFVSHRGFENIRMIRKNTSTGATGVYSYSPESLAASVSEALGEEDSFTAATMAKVEQIMRPARAEMYFSHVPVLVEGREDIAYLSQQLKLRGDWEEFRRLGCHLVDCGGKTNLSRPIAIANGLEIPAVVMFDADAGDAAKDKARSEQHSRDNRCLIRLCDEEVDVFPEEPYYGDRLIIWPNKIADTVMADFAEEVWRGCEHQARVAYNLQVGIRRKEPLLIAGTLEALADRGAVSGTLNRACDAILEYAGKVREAV